MQEPLNVLIQDERSELVSDYIILYLYVRILKITHTFAVADRDKNLYPQLSATCL